jgi:hypothetical protein
MTRSSQGRYWFRCVLVSMCVLVLRLAPLLAQTDEPLPDDPPPWGDLASDQDPSLLPDDPQFELPLDPYTGSEVYLEPEGGDSLDVMPPDPTSAPQPGQVEAPSAWSPVTCSTVKPLRLAAAKPRYFSYWGVPQLLVGASADAGCVLNLAQKDQCYIANYSNLFTTAHNLGLNKVRVWVALGYGYDDVAANPAILTRLPNAPFLWVTPASGSPYWLLDTQGGPVAGFAAFFDRLRTVVDMARSQNLFVEVTFFSPFEGQAFNSGPWSMPGGKSRAADPPSSTNLVPAGFSSPFYAVTNDTSSAAALTNEKMRRYQTNIIKWTVETLWCYDNVYWEIANEPEGLTRDVDNIQKAADPLAVTRWQKAMIYEVRKAEKVHSPNLAYGHLIAVQPFTQAGADALLAPATAPPGWTLDPSFPLDPQVLNGHYTNVPTQTVTRFPNGQTFLDRGAIDFVRDRNYNRRNLPVGFNENAISNLGGERGTKRHLNGSTTLSLPLYVEASARAEAWEYFFSGGSTYDHYGYLGTNQLPNLNSIAIAVRTQLGRLNSLFANKFGLQPAPSLTAFQTANISPWFNPGTYRAWEARTASQRYWAALEVPVGSHRALLFYLHHSTPRCKPNSNDYNQGCPNNSFLPFGSYDARVWTLSPPGGGPAGYQESFTLATSGSYTATWIDPETTATLSGPQSITCPPSCTITSPVYKFDLMLRLFRQ